MRMDVNKNGVEGRMGALWMAFGALGINRVVGKEKEKRRLECESSLFFLF